MQVESSLIPEVLLLTPTVHEDERGFFLESFNRRDFARLGIDERFVQDNHSRSRRGTLRGLHLQWRRPQGKLVRATQGEVLDVAVDVRRGSPTFGRWVAAVLSAENFRQCYVPRGFAHGFCVLSETAEIQYKCSDYYDPGGEISIAWDDPDLGIEWPVDTPTLSEKDARGALLSSLTKRLPVFGG